jgi:hypothetical protein
MPPQRVSTRLETEPIYETGSRDCFKHGAYSDIFHIENGRVVKLFISRNHRTNVNQELTTPEHFKRARDKRRQQTFVSEYEAYEIAMKDPFLRNHIPQFFGRVEISDVLDNEGRSVSDWYLLDCCYALEYIEGDDVKLSECRRRGWRHISELEEALQEAGISYLCDASLFMSDDVTSFKIIDFAKEGIVPAWDELEGGEPFGSSWAVMHVTRSNLDFDEDVPPPAPVVVIANAISSSPSRNVSTNKKEKDGGKSPSLPRDRIVPEARSAWCWCRRW